MIYIIDLYPLQAVFRIIENGFPVSTAKYLLFIKLAESPTPNVIGSSSTKFKVEENTMKVTVSWFSVKDFEQAKKFYGESLGLKKTFEMEQWAEFAGGEGEASIGLAVNPHAGREPGATIVLQVPDIEHERKRLESRGVSFEGKTEEIPGMVKLATFRDPSGNRLQLCQVLMHS
jgi:predicted enzyme related to lactoylglutathione lyase